MERLGVDPAEAARAGGGTALAAASRRCLYCSSAEICRHWLDETGEGEAPAFCPNASFLDRARASSVGEPTAERCKFPSATSRSIERAR